MKNSYNPFCAECSFEKFTKTSPIIVLSKTPEGISGDYYENPFAYMDEKLEAVRDIYDSNMDEIGGCWSYSEHEFDRATLIAQQEHALKHNPHYQMHEQEDIAEAEKKLAAGVLITVTKREGEEIPCASVADALKIFAQNFEDGAATSSPEVYFLTDEEFAQEMRKALANNARELSAIFGLIIVHGRQDHKEDFKLPAAEAVYNKNIKMYKDLREELHRGIC